MLLTWRVLLYPYRGFTTYWQQWQAGPTAWPSHALYPNEGAPRGAKSLHVRGVACPSIVVIVEQALCLSG